MHSEGSVMSLLSLVALFLLSLFFSISSSHFSSSFTFFLLYLCFFFSAIFSPLSLLLCPFEPTQKAVERMIWLLISNIVIGKNLWLKNDNKNIYLYYFIMTGISSTVHGLKQRCCLSIRRSLKWMSYSWKFFCVHSLVMTTRVSSLVLRRISYSV